jgi:uncharacterized protein YcnI
MSSHMSLRTLARLGAVPVALGATFLATAAPAAAHVTISASTTAAGAFTVLTVSVPHGCEGSPTTEVTVQIPEGINAVTPTRNALWEVAKEVEQLDPPLTDAHGNELTERVATVTYTARTPLPDGYRDAFELSVQLPEEEGRTLVFPTIQTCEKAEAAWIEVPQDGQGEDALELPAPAITITAAEGDAHGAAEPDEESEDDTGPGGDLGAWGLGVGIVGLLVGAFAVVQARRRS